MTITTPDQSRNSRKQARILIERDAVRNGILGLIIFNAILLGLSTSSVVMEHFGPVIRGTDALTPAVLVVELSIKFYAYGFRFFRSWWNVFDRHGNQIALPCSETLVTLDGHRMAVQRGDMPVMAVKGRGELRLGSFNAFSGGALQGAGSDQMSPVPALAPAPSSSSQEADAMTDLDDLLAGFDDPGPIRQR